MFSGIIEAIGQVRRCSDKSGGKTLVVATTHGNQPTDVTVDGKPLIVGVNAYIRNR